MYQTMSHELARQDYAQRLAQSQHDRAVEAARRDRQPSENIGRPPDPRRATARRTPLADAFGALLHRTAA
ncbi:hypothetical protein [Cellulomonas sp. ICMP 17802]|uniref:hypothetical protein n=1 Tax=Cellulomonas sp. ICMP 17802 TaxID=3239199 RepID=UPI00351BA080